MQNILYINGYEFDYMADSFLIGLKKLKEFKVFELPANLYIYNKKDNTLTGLHGKGFTLGNVVDGSEQIAFKSINLNEIDIFIFSSIHRQFGLYLQFFHYLNKNNTIIIDGEDHPSVFPYSSLFLKHSYFWLIPKPHKKFLYFKRELIQEEINRSLYFRLSPMFVNKRLSINKNFHSISFSIPVEKIVATMPAKHKMFPKHIVDEEVATRVPGSYTKYAFEKEEDYYADLQASKFGITTKKAGWDCMRHYEIAANGTVLCFKQLHKKPTTCAPHGLKHNFNCISYEDYDDLMKKISALSDEQYKTLLENTRSWVLAHTCENIAESVLKILK